ncbi:MAG: hypothetical protein R3F44_01505 [Candidatus Competibacteraceae bacterium]
MKKTPARRLVAPIIANMIFGSTNLNMLPGNPPVSKEARIKTMTCLKRVRDHDRLYVLLKLIPEVLIVSMLPPEQFGQYYATGHKYKSRTSDLFEVDRLPQRVF